MQLPINKNICLILAHHDDETLFYGGLLSKIYKNNKIYLITLCDIKNENKNFYYEKKHNNYVNICNIFNINYTELNLIIYNNNNIQKLENINKEIENINKEIENIKKDIENIVSKMDLLNKQKQDLVSKKDLLNKEKRKFINSYIIDDNNIKNVKNIKNILKKTISDFNINFDYIFTHNNLGEYGHIDHKIVNYIVNSLKNDLFKDKIIMIPSNEITELKIKIDKEEKQNLLKKYDFKDTDDKLNIWFDQTIKSYSFWSNNAYEYFEIMK